MTERQQTLDALRDAMALVRRLPSLSQQLNLTPEELCYVLDFRTITYITEAGRLAAQGAGVSTEGAASSADSAGLRRSDALVPPSTN